MNVQFYGNQSMPVFLRKKTINEPSTFDLNRVKSIQSSQVNGEYLVDFLRVSEKLFSFEKLLNHTFIK
ncbi:MAG: hypothetical protein L3J70_00950 [Gammaproteobacteria bacterium]|nr:hypothetical protein [Gammaproteobacteria bacterium]